MSKKFGHIKKFFHASPKRFKKGALLARNGAVFMTDSAMPHYTIFDEAIAGGWHVYEVKPLAKVYFGFCWDEAITDQAEVVRYVGTARGIAAGKNKKSGSKVLFKNRFDRDCAANPGEGWAPGKIYDKGIWVDKWLWDLTEKGWDKEE